MTLNHLSMTAALALLMTLSACGDKGDGSTETEGTTTMTPTTEAPSTTEFTPTTTMPDSTTTTTGDESSTSGESSTSTGPIGTTETGSSSESSSSDTTGGGLPDGSDCSDDAECAAGNCYEIPFIGGFCGECNEDADCPDGGCSPPNPFMSGAPACNMGEAGGGCETSAVCMDGLVCGNVFDILGTIQIDTCGECSADGDCMANDICAPAVTVAEFKGVNECIAPGSRPQDAYCLLEGNGDDACMSGICSAVDVMGLAEIGACGECDTDADCNGGTCEPGALDLGTGSLTGSTCV